MSSLKVSAFEESRSKLFAIAYRMVGTPMEAEDLVQDTYLRWQSADFSTINTPKAWLITTVTRVCIDYLRLARVQRETYPGEWLPAPLAAMPLPEATIAEQETLSIAFLHVAERLTPVERAVLILREAFEYDFATIAQIIDKSASNTRQILRRARQHIEADRPRFDTPLATREQLFLQFLVACQTGNVDDLIAILNEEIVSYSDGGGRVSGVARKPIVGQDKVARFLLGLARRGAEQYRAEPCLTNGMPTVAVYEGDRLYALLILHIQAGKIRNCFNVVNPEKLVHMQ